MWTGLFLLCVGVLFAAFPTCDDYFDGITFALAVDGVAAGGEPAWLFHPHHLLYGPVAYAWHAALAAAAPGWRPHETLALLSTLAALAALFSFVRALTRRGFGPAAALCGAALPACAYSFWRFGTTPETTMPTAAVLLAVWARLAAPPRADRRPAARTVASLLALAALLHASALLAAPAVCLRLAAGLPLRDGVRLGARFLLSTLLRVAAVYAVVAVFVLGMRDPVRILDWSSGYLRPDPRTGYRVEYAGLRWDAWKQSGVAWARGWTGPPERTPGGSGPSGRPAAVIAAILCAWAAFAAFSGARGRGEDPGFARGLLIWLATHAAFFAVWNPGNPHFWMMALPGWALLLLLPLRETGPGARRPRLAAGGSALLALLTASAALPAMRAASRPAWNPYRGFSERLRSATDPGATVVLSGVGPHAALKAYVPYFALRRMLVLDWQFSDRAIPAEARRARLSRRLETEARSGRLFVVSEAVSRDHDAHFGRTHGLPAGALRGLLPPERLESVFRSGPGLDLLRVRAPPG